MTTEAEAIAKLAESAHALREPVTLELPGGKTMLFTPGGLIPTDVSDPNRNIEEPAHIRQSVTVQTVDSLVDYINSFKVFSTRMFADIAANKIVSLIDYHGISDGEFHGQADHLFHRATMTLPHSEEWKTWTKASGAMISQLEFARFLEENSADIEAPSGADLLEVCRDLHAIRKANFKKAVRTNTDHETFEYSEETTATSKGVEVPTKFALRIPVYFGGETTPLFAFLRWKLDDGNLMLGIVLHRAEHVRQAVFKQIVLDVGARTERPVVFGSV